MDSRCEDAVAALRTLEARAGIADEIEDANLGPLIPNFDATPDEHSRETEDYVRHRVRRIYFGLKDVELRKKLISAQIEVDRAFDDRIEREVHDARVALAKAKRSAMSAPWLGAAAEAAACVALGAIFFQAYGAIAGAIAGFFIGQRHVEHGRNRRSDLVREATYNLEQMENVEKENRRSRWFTKTESITGEPEH